MGPPPTTVRHDHVLVPGLVLFRGEKARPCPLGRRHRRDADVLSGPPSLQRRTMGPPPHMLLAIATVAGPPELPLDSEGTLRLQIPGFPGNRVGGVLESQSIATHCLRAARGGSHAPGKASNRGHDCPRAPGAADSNGSSPGPASPRAGSGTGVRRPAPMIFRRSRSGAPPWTCGRKSSLPIADCGLRIADWKKRRCLVFQSEIHNPKSAMAEEDRAKCRLRRRCAKQQPPDAGQRCARRAPLGRARLKISHRCQRLYRRVGAPAVDWLDPVEKSVSKPSRPQSMM
jgi:hypothetical protein